MWNSFLLSVNVIAPMFLSLAVGVLFRKLGIINDDTVQRITKICYNSMLSCTIFNSIYNSGLSNMDDCVPLWFCVLGVIVECAIGIYALKKMRISSSRKAGIVQALFRTNLLLVGLPIAYSVYNNNLGIIPFTIAVLIPLFNVLGVISLSFFDSDMNGKSIKKAIWNFFRNPLIIASILAFICLLFNIKLPQFAENTVESFSQAATPVALLTLGATFSIKSVNNDKTALTVVVMLRLLIIPAIAIAAAYAIGLRAANLLLVLIVFGTPTGTVSYVLTQQMDADAKLSGEIVIFSTLFSCFSLILFIFILKSLNLI